MNVARIKRMLTRKDVAILFALPTDFVVDGIINRQIQKFVLSSGAQRQFLRVINQCAEVHCQGFCDYIVNINLV